MDKVRAALEAGRPAFVLWVAGGDPVSAEMIGRAGYDGVILDNQHGGITWDNMLPLIQALELGGTRALVRPAANDPTQIMRALDLGALGVVVPMVSTEAQARSAAEAARYPPAGVRSFGPVRSYYGAGGAPAEPLCLAMIETAEALENLEAIAAAPGIDGLFVGPVDLALSLGLGLRLDLSEGVLAALDRVVAACRRHGKISASASLDLAYSRALLERGVRFIAQGSDLNFVRRAAAADVAELAGLAGEFGGASASA